MTIIDLDPSTLGDAALAAELAELEAEERKLSKRRDALHRRIDFLRASGGGGHEATSSDELLASLVGEEAYVSKERRATQTRVDALRAEQLRRRATA